MRFQSLSGWVREVQHRRTATRTFAEQILSGTLAAHQNGDGPMIDRQAMQDDLARARQARLEAEAANADVEEMLWEIQHIRLGHQRMVFSIEGLLEQDLAA